MENLHIEATKYTPYIKLDAEKGFCLFREKATRRIPLIFINLYWSGSIAILQSRIRKKR